MKCEGIRYPNQENVMCMHIHVCVYMHRWRYILIHVGLYTQHRSGNSKGKLCGFCHATKGFFTLKVNTWFVTHYSLNLYSCLKIEAPELFKKKLGSTGASRQVPLNWVWDIHVKSSQKTVMTFALTFWTCVYFWTHSNSHNWYKSKCSNKQFWRARIECLYLQSNLIQLHSRPVGLCSRNSYNESSDKETATVNQRCAWSNLKDCPIRSTTKDLSGLIAFKMSGCYPKEHCSRTMWILSFL